MMVPPLSERPVTEEDEEQFRRESAPRKYTLRRRWADYRAEVKARRPKGARARARAWLHVEPFYWGMRVTYVALFAGAVFAVLTRFPLRILRALHDHPQHLRQNCYPRGYQRVPDKK